MRITCPHCGTRDLAEFYYWGDATRTMPDLGSADEAAWLDHVYNRPNPRGRHKEYWQHLGGCRAFLVVERDTQTHEVFSVAFAREDKPAIAFSSLIENQAVKNNAAKQKGGAKK